MTHRKEKKRKRNTRWQGNEWRRRDAGRIRG
jgi:hypothetical protein